MKNKFSKIKAHIKEKLGLKQLRYMTTIYRFFKKILSPVAKLLPSDWLTPDNIGPNEELNSTIQIKTSDTVSVVLSGYQRPHTLREQYQAVLSQTHKPNEILFWQNKSSKEADFDEQVISEMKASRSNFNFGVWARFAYALNCKSKFICILDDDTIPGEKWVENCLESFKKKPGLYGTIGLVYKSKDSYFGASRFGWDGTNNEEIVQVDIVGHAWFFEREMLSTYWRELCDIEDIYVGEDMHFSHMLQKYTNLKTYVPPHPINNKDLWGSLKGDKYGGESVATGSFAVSMMDRYYKKIIERGFKIINDNE